MSDWADEKARGWLRVFLPEVHERSHTAESLAALLREVEQAGWIDGHTTGAEEGARDMVPISADRGSVFIDGQGDVDLAPKVLAEVRRVVEGVKAEGYYTSTCDEILSRLEKL